MSTNNTHPEDITTSIATCSASASASNSKDQQQATSNKGIFNSQDFMDFLKNQDISKLTVLTKSGTLLSASFNAADHSTSIDSALFKSGDSLFKSGDFFKSIESQQVSVSDDSKSSTDLPVVASANNSGSSSRDSPSLPNSVSNMYASKGLGASGDWTKDFKPSHLLDVDADIKYSRIFDTADSQQTLKHALPPKKRPQTQGKTDWNEMYMKGLSYNLAHSLSPALLEAAALASPQPVVGGGGEETVDASKSEIPAIEENPAAPKSKSKRKPRKVIPKHKEFVDIYTDVDVLFGRGGRSNHHPGNKNYRDKIMETQDYYRSRDKNEKTQVAQNLVDSVVKEGGRFLELCKVASRWYLVPNIVARRKVGQALRENNTEEARAAKREKYGHAKKKA
jgi:hypothetical protein